jgi:hypothetical protein
MRLPPEHGLGAIKIPIWLNHRRTKFLTSFRKRLETYYGQPADSWRDRYIHERLGYKLDDQKWIAQNFTFLATGPDFGPYVIDRNTGKPVELFLEITQLQCYPDGLNIVKNRLDRAIALYRADRALAFKRTLNPQKMISWIYDSMGQMPEEHFKYWLLNTGGAAYRFFKNVFAVIGVIALFLGILVAVVDLGSFLGHKSALEKAGHRAARWLHLEKPEHHRDQN